MNSLLLGIICGLLLGLVWTSPVMPVELTPLSEEERKQIFEILRIVTPMIVMVSIAVFLNKWMDVVMAVVTRIGAKLPSWMTKEIGQ